MTLDETNLNRLWGLSQSDVGHPKVNLFRRIVSLISSDIHVQAFKEKIPSKEFEAKLIECSVIFGCFDGSEARLATQVLAAMYNKMYIDVGVSLYSEKDTFIGNGQIFTYENKTSPCILCSGLELTGPGYLRDDLGEPIPSTGVLNSIVASVAVSVWLKLIQDETIEPVVRFSWPSLSFSYYIPKKRNDCPICNNPQIGPHYLEFKNAESSIY